VYTTASAYIGGVLAPNGDIHFVPFNANRGQKINSSGTVSTYSLVYTTASAYFGGVLATNGDIHFVPYSAAIGQKISSAGVVSTYSLIYTTVTAYRGGVLAPNGDIHFLPFNAVVGQKINPDGSLELYELPSQKFDSGVLAQNGDVVFLPTNSSTFNAFSSVFGARLDTTIAVSDLRGKSFRKKIILVPRQDVENYDVYANTILDSNYSVGFSDVTLVVDYDVNISSNTTSLSALTVPSQFSPRDTVTIHNYGTIVGKGGDGGQAPLFATGSQGGPSIFTFRPLTIQNVGTIAGGGGGGAGGIFATVTPRPPKQGGPLTTTIRGGGGGGGGGGPRSGPPSGFGGGGGLGSQGQPGQPGGNVSGGAGGAGTAPATPGASGGDRGIDGGSTPGGSRGQSGFYITGNSFTTFTQTGSRLGRIN
jgi:hypothetical protein